MIHDAMIHAGHTRAVLGLTAVFAHPNPHMTKDHIPGAAHAQLLLTDTDTFAGGRLAGNGDVRLAAADGDVVIERDQTGDGEDDRVRRDLCGVVSACVETVV